MDFTVQADLIPLLRGLVIGLKPYAKVQEVGLDFYSDTDELLTSYNPQKVLTEITILLSRVITFTPQGFYITVSASRCLESNNKCFLKVANTGVNLSKLGEIIASVSRGLSIKQLPKGTLFVVEIPIGKENLDKAGSNKTELLPKQYPPYFSEIHKRLTHYFDHTDKIQAAAEHLSAEYGFFMKKVNTVINLNLNNNSFSVDELAKEMALSRTQLFRKIKHLAQMSPSAYIRFTRLQEAKRLLQDKNKNYNVTEVSYTVGFSNVSHFTRSFKKQFGLNPSSLVV